MNRTSYRIDIYKIFLYEFSWLIKNLHYHANRKISLKGIIDLYPKAFMQHWRFDNF